jgi:hypothetical protein
MFFVLFALFLLLMAFCYWKAPQKIIREKMEYVLFLLLFGAGYLFLHGAAIKILDILGILGWNTFRLISILVFPLLLFIAHFLYPFKNVTENLRQHVYFFLFFAALLSMAIAGFFILLGLSNM